MRRPRRDTFWEWYSRAIPPRLLRLASTPIHRQLSAEQASAFETARMLHLAFAFVRAEGVTGDYHEFGVYEGRTFADAWEIVRFHRLNIRLHAYDSFAGLPRVGGFDVAGPYTSGEFRAGRAVFARTMKTRQVPASRFTVTEGYFETTLGDAPRHPVAVAFIDCNLYESTVPVLAFLTETLSDGAIIMFDDWFSFHGRPDRGEQRACAEWLAQNPSIRLVPYRDFGWCGRSFIVNRA